LVVRHPLILVLHNLWIKFVVTAQELDPREVNFKEMLRTGRGEMDPEEIVEQQSHCKRSFTHRKKYSIHTANWHR
jgi:hypothetical protein